MSAAEIKASLKEAKNAIKEKDFEAAMKHCKAVLKADRKNYNALVMFGRACQECDRLEDSKKVLLLASQLDPSLPVAWMGLATLFDKNALIASKEDMIYVYDHLSNISTEEDKIESFHRKLAKAYQDSDRILDSVDVLFRLVPKMSSPQRITDAWKSCVELLISIPELPECEVPKLITALENILNQSVLGENEKNYQLYLQYLYKSKQINKLIEGAVAMHEIFPSAYPLEWLARCFVERSSQLNNETHFPLAREVVLENVDNLLRLTGSSSPWGNIAKGVVLRDQGSLLDARPYLRKGAEALSKNIHVWLLLLNLLEKLDDWSGIEVVSRKILDLMPFDSCVASTLQEDPESMRQQVALLRATALFEIGHPSMLKQAVDVLEEQEDQSKEVMLLLMKCWTKMGNYEMVLEKLDHLDIDDIQYKLVRATVLRSKGDSSVAFNLYEEIVSKVPDNAEAVFEMGRICFETEDPRALMLLLKAAKLNPRMASAFLYLGNYYRKEKNLDKSRKCYEKAFSLSPNNNEVGAGLSDVYRYLGDHSANLALLLRVTSEAGRASCGWAWLRLGLHYQGQGEFNLAVQALQFATQICPTDCTYFECLGDAYYARGSYTAALKVFTKALNLNPDELYPAYKIAQIKQILGELQDAAAEYEGVLHKNPPPAVRVVASVGYAEALIASARAHYKNFFHSNVKTDLLHAIEILSCTASERPQSVTVWKLIGHACTSLAPLPPSLSTFSVPESLLSAQKESHNKMVSIDKIQILELGAKCYGVGLHLAVDDSSLWHDIAINLYLQSKQHENEERVKDLILRSITCIKKSLSLEPAEAKYWDSFGIISSHKAVRNVKTAQHAFITSLKLQPKAPTWTHLGVLYLQENDALLAHEAFSQAQAIDPLYVACWTGQALVAETVGHSDTFDLFRHTHLLGIHTESCLGHAHHVTNLISEENVKKKRCQDLFRLSVPSALDSLFFYTREIENDPVALNMLGLTLEVSGMLKTASEVYCLAYEAARDQKELPQKFIDGVLCNYGRILTQLGKTEEAVESYKAIKEPDFISQCGLALASIKGGKYEEAYNGYTAAFHWLAPDDAQKSQILVALAFLQYHFHRLDEAKNLLFQSSQLKNASVEGLLALVSLGLLQGDATLLAAAFSELKSYENEAKYAHHLAFLRAASVTNSGNPLEGKHILCRAVHRFPWIAPLWRSLSLHLLTFSEHLPQRSIASSTVSAASSALQLAQSYRDKHNINKDAAVVVLAHLKMTSQAHACSKAGLLAAQRAVLACPDSPEAWALMIAATTQISGFDKVMTYARYWSKSVSGSLSKWFESVIVQMQ